MPDAAVVAFRWSDWCSNLLTCHGRRCIKKLIPQYLKTPVIVLIIFNLCICCFLVTVQTLYYFWQRRKQRRGAPVKMRQSIKFTYMLAGAQLSWFTVLFGKSFSSLILLSFAGDNQFTDPFVIVIVVAFIISLPSQL